MVHRKRRHHTENQCEASKDAKREVFEESSGNAGLMDGDMDKSSLRSLSASFRMVLCYLSKLAVVVLCLAAVFPSWVSKSCLLILRATSNALTCMLFSLI